MESHSIILYPSLKPDKKWTVKINNKSIHFGSKGNYDFTLHDPN